MKDLGILLLSLWLIATGVLSLVPITVPAGAMILALLAVVAGLLLLLERKRIRLSNPGNLVLGIWLIAAGLLPVLNISFPARDEILALLAIAAGVLLLLRR